ncbi:MAG: hypothetical protein K6F53_09205 [Lachnospiraceae bacterium]|nr:hypothetical protein [Lachnospiraceae bacterium]
MRPERIRFFTILILTLLTVGIASRIPIPGNIRFARANFDMSSLETKGDDEMITDKDREVVYVYLIEEMKRLDALNNLSYEAKARMEQVFYQANVFIANTDMTVSQLEAYMKQIDADIAAASEKSAVDAQQFIYLSNSNPVTSAKYGSDTLLVLSVVNLGKTDIRDLVLTPTVDTDPKKWPFVIKTASDTRMIPVLPAAESVEASYNLRMDIGWEFTVKKDALTGTYPLTFHARYYRNDKIEEADLMTYINVTGAPGSGYLNETKDANEKTSTPRIIVTGFTTDPAEVYAGDTFHLTIYVQNTSQRTTVSNIQFDLKAAKEGKEQDTIYEAFLPTSGSSTVYMNSIAPGASAEIGIEMTARSDLVQKPYVVELTAEYEDEKNNPFTASANVSIPVHQEARVDTGDVEIAPESIEVGGSSNIMFSVYNKGKTILYNVQVDFVGDSIKSSSAFLGKIESGGTGNVDVMVEGIAPTTDDGTIRAVISYEDDAGRVKTIEKEMTLFVEEAFEDIDYTEMYGDEMEEDPGAKKGLGKKWILIGGIAAAVVAAAVIVIITVSKRRKKKKERELTEDLDDDI